MGFWSKLGKIASFAAPIVAAPFTGGASLALIGAGAGAAGGALGGGGWKGALTGGAMGAIPGLGGTSGLAKGAVAPTLAQGLKQAGTSALKSAGTNLGSGLLSRAGVPGAPMISNFLGSQFGSQFGSPNGASGGSGGGGFGGFVSPGMQQQAGSFGGFLPKLTGVMDGGSGGFGGTSTGPLDWKRLLSNAVGTVANPRGNVVMNARGGTGGGGGPQGGGGSAPGSDPQSQGAQGFWDTWGPVIAQGAGVGIGAMVGRQATKNAQARSPEEQAALRGATGIAGQTGRMGGQLYRQGSQNLQGPANFYQTLLSGNRAAMSNVVAPAVAQLTANYRGAGRALEHSGLRGAQRDLAAADLNRQRASQIAGLTTGVQAGAASGLSGIGGTQLQTAPGLLSTSGNIYGGMLGQGYQNRVYGRLEGEKTASAIGGLARDAGEIVFNKGKGGAKTPKTPTQPTAPTQVRTQAPVYQGQWDPPYTPPFSGGGDIYARQPPIWGWANG